MHSNNSLQENTIQGSFLTHIGRLIFGRSSTTGILPSIFKPFLTHEIVTFFLDPTLNRCSK